MSPRPLLPLMFILGSVYAHAQDACVAPPRHLRGEQLVYQGPNHWFVSEGRTLFEIRADKLVATVTHDEPRLQLVCGKDDEVLAFTSDKVFRIENATLVRIPAKFPGILAHTDGKNFYSWTMKPENFFSAFATLNGKTRRIAMGKIGFDQSEGYFVVSDNAGYTVFQDGKAIIRGNKPKKSQGLSSFVVGGLMSCRRSLDGIFLEGLDQFYTVRSAKGDASITTPGFISLGASRQQCSEYVLLLRDYDFPERDRVLWSFIPSEGPPPKRIPTPCRVNDFALNEDGSLHYRCGNTLYFKDASRTRDTTLGTLPFKTGIRDRWLPIPGYGTLYTAVFETNNPADPPRQACFFRLQGEKMIKIACAPITPEKRLGW